MRQLSLAFSLALMTAVAAAHEVSSDPDHQYEHGLAYFQGKDHAKDISKANAWFLKAAEAGHADAMFYVGLAFFDRSYGTVDYAKAVSWFRKSAAQNSALGQHGMGLSHLYGRAVDHDLLKAIGWFQMAADQGQRAAQYYLGTMYDAGRGVEKNHKKAAQLFEQSARQGFTSAQYDLAEAYVEGKGVEQSYALAAKWHQAASEQGFEPSQVSLAELYEEGLGVEQDLGAALIWYELACKDGCSWMISEEIAGFYEQGKGVDVDLVQAYFWYSKSNNAKEKIEALKEKMSKEEQSIAYELVREYKMGLPRNQYIDCELDSEGKAKTFPSNYPLSNVTITLEKRGCFGSCPKYRVEISGDGYLLLEELSEPSLGTKAGEIEAKAFEELLRAFYKADFFSRKPEYSVIPSMGVTEYGTVQSLATTIDHGSNTTIGLTIGHCSKEINLHYGIPSVLRELTEMIDKTVETDAWLREISSSE